jgi:methylated-DNA-[protein]-cysteine S-methyltransferase
MARVLGFCLFDTALGAAASPGRSTRSRPCSCPRRMPPARGGACCATPASAKNWRRRLSCGAAITRIQALLTGARDDLADLPLALEGVPEFHRQVYAVARAIPPGEVLTYGEVARRIGEPGAARAVGQALGRNPFAPVVPCHRVLAAGGRSGGFSAEGGAATKLKMLEIEQARFDEEPGLF